MPEVSASSFPSHPPASSIACEPAGRTSRTSATPSIHGASTLTTRRSMPRCSTPRAKRTWTWWRWRSEIGRAPTQPSLPYAEAGPILSEGASRDLVGAYGVPLVSAERASTEQEALLAAERVGYPVVMKAHAPGVAHKAAAGLVRTGIGSPEAARKAFRELGARAAVQTEQSPAVLVGA